MRVRIGIGLLVVISCTSKPEAVAPDALGAPALQFSGLGVALKHNVEFAVGVSVRGDISLAASGDATKALTITLSKRVGNGNWEQAGQQVASTNNEASFNLTLPEGSYTLKAETSGAATLSGESDVFTVVSGDATAGGDGVELSFSEDSYSVKMGELFAVTVEVAESDKLAAGTLVVLKMLKDDGDEAGMLMQWHSSKDSMQPPGEALTAEVNDGKAEFKDLFVVDSKDVTKLQAVLEHKGESVVAEADLGVGDAEVSLTKVQVSDQRNNILSIKLNPPPDGEYKTVDIYFFQDNDDEPVTVHGAHSGSAQYVPNAGLHQNVSPTADLDKHCYKHLAIKLAEGGVEGYAFLHDGVVNGNPNCDG